jgi:hypothetical protein
MCWEIDYQFLAEQKRAQEAKETKIRQEEQRSGVIQALLSEANKQGDETKTETTPIKEAAPAK